MTGRGNSIPPVLQRLVFTEPGIGLVVAVDDIQAAMRQVTEAGG